MAGRRGFAAELQRDLARRRREAEQAQRAAVREAQRIDREAQRACGNRSVPRPRTRVNVPAW